MRIVGCLALVLLLGSAAGAAGERDAAKPAFVLKRVAKSSGSRST
jgi:hypothetical protein